MVVIVQPADYLLLADLTFLSFLLSIYPRIVEVSPFRKMMFVKAFIPVLLILKQPVLFIAMLTIVHSLATTIHSIWWEKCHG